jgi:lipopolysaccharide export system protein LptA
MQEIPRRKLSGFGLGVRAHAPLVGRVLAMALLVAGVIAVGVAIYRRRGVHLFRPRSEAAQLSTREVGRVENYERVMMDGDHVRARLKAARDVWFDDGHHELEIVHLEIYPKEGGDKPNVIDAKRAIYDYDNQRGTFTGDVRIETRDALKVNTESVVFNVKDEKAQIPTPLTFTRENVAGRADAADVDSKNKKLSLRGNTEVNVTPTEKNAKNESRNQPLKITAPKCDYDDAWKHISFSGGATAEQDHDIMSGESLSAQLTNDRRVQHIQAHQNAYLRSMSEGHAAEIHAADIDFFFNDQQKLERATANSSARDVIARTLGADADVTVQNTNAMEAKFIVQNGQSLLQQMNVVGRPTVTLAAPKSKANDPRAANKRLTADDVHLFWRASGKDLERAEATGNAELIVEPVQATEKADKKTLTAPRFDVEFYESDNKAKTFTATGGAKVVLEPMKQPADAAHQRTVRTLTSDKMTAQFLRDTQDVERFDANGNAKFNDADRNGQAANIAYTSADAMVRLRGGEPVVWDARARTKANELDSDLEKKISYGRGKVATTYYNQEQTNGAAPFAKTKSPVFVIADTVEFQHEEQTAFYRGNARLWQDDNFVRANTITLRNKNKRMEGEGNVQSALYRAKRKEKNGAQTVVPVFATSARMFYSDPDHLVHYEENVDIKQGTERITSGAADVYLKRSATGDNYEVDRTVAQRDVVITQPGKKGTGDRADYTAADEVAVLTGNPARVEDAEQGTSQSRRLTMYLRENRVVGDAPEGEENTGRVHSVHKVRKQ